MYLTKKYNLIFFNRVNILNVPVKLDFHCNLPKLVQHEINESTKHGFVLLICINKAFSRP